MASATRHNKDVDRLFDQMGGPQQHVARALRELILETGPELQEKSMYGTPWYRGKGLVFAIAAHSAHTNLEFSRGTSLRDPAGLLEGTGKNMRHVKIRSVGDLESPQLRALLHEAIDLDTR